MRGRRSARRRARSAVNSSLRGGPFDYRQSNRWIAVIAVAMIVAAGIGISIESERYVVRSIAFGVLTVAAGVWWSVSGRRQDARADREATTSRTDKDAETATGGDSTQPSDARTTRD